MEKETVTNPVLITVIRTEILKHIPPKGPSDVITQYWTLDGSFLAQNPSKEQVGKMINGSEKFLFSSAKLITVIEVKELRGKDTTDDPYYVVTQYKDLDGNLLAEEYEERRT